VRPFQVVLVDAEEQFIVLLVGFKWNGIPDAALFEVGRPRGIAEGKHFIAVVRRVGKVVRETHGLKVLECKSPEVQEHPGLWKVR
jgi:hypothetical protein